MTSAYTVHFADLQGQDAAVVRGQVPMSGIADFLGAAFGEVMATLGAQRNTVVGPPFARYRVVAGRFDVEAGFPCQAPVSPTGRVEPATLPAGRVASTLHVGDYAGVAQAYDAVMHHVTEEGYEPCADPWESYLDDPTVPEPRTEVFLPCRPRRPHPVS